MIRIEIDTSDEQINLRESAERGGAALGLQSLTGQIIRAFSTIVLMRILGPEQFGIVGLATIFKEVVLVFSKFGIGDAIIQRGGKKHDIATGNLIEATRSIIFSIVLILAAPLAADFFSTPEVANVLRVMAITLLIHPLSFSSQVQLRANLRFGMIAFIAVIGSIVHYSTAILLALAGYQYMSLVYSTLLSTISTMILSWIICRPIMPIGARWDDAKAIGRFGMHLMIGGVAYWLFTNLDDAIVGKVEGTNILGLYSKAYYIATISSETLGRVILGLSFPIFAKIKDDAPRLRRVYNEAFSFNLFICIPAIIGIMILAEPITAIVFGPKWLGMIQLLTLTCVSSLLRVVYHNNGSLYKAIGRPDYGWKIALLMVAIIPSLGYMWTRSMGAPGMVWSIILAWIIGFILHTYLTFWKIFPFDRQRTLKDNAPILYCTGIMTVIVYGVRPFAINLPNLLIIVGMGFGSYIISLYFLGGRRLVNEMIDRTKRLKSVNRQK